MKKNTAKKAKRATEGERITTLHIGPIGNDALAKQIDRAIRRAVREAATKAYALGHSSARSSSDEMAPDMSAFKARYGVKL